MRQAGGDVRLLPVLVLMWFLSSVLPALCGDIPTPFEAERLVGRQAPDFSLRDLDGRTVSLSALKGKVVLINFWGTWSPPSRDELPALERLFRRMRTRGLDVVAVSTDTSRDRVREFLKDSPVSFPVVPDEGRTLSRSVYKVFVVPTSFVIARDGRILKSYYGSRRWDSRELLSEIEETVMNER